MAQFELHGFDDLMMQLDRLGRTDEVAPKMLEEAVPILQEEVVNQAEKHRDTGEMAASIKPTKVTKSADGYRVVVRPTGKASGRNVRNMEKLVYLEYGVRGRPATPVLTTAVLNARPDVIYEGDELVKSDELLKKTLEQTGLPAKYQEYRGTKEAYLVYNEEDERSIAHADDRPQAVSIWWQVHLFAPEGYDFRGMKRRLRALILEAGFAVRDAVTLFEKETGSIHVILSCNMTEDMEDETWQKLD